MLLRSLVMRNYFCWLPGFSASLWINHELLMHGSHGLVYRDVLPKGKRCNLMCCRWCFSAIFIHLFIFCFWCSEIRPSTLSSHWTLTSSINVFTLLDPANCALVYLSHTSFDAIFKSLHHNQTGWWYSLAFLTVLLPNWLLPVLCMLVHSWTAN